MDISINELCLPCGRNLSVIAAHFQVRPQVFKFEKTLKIAKCIKDALSAWVGQADFGKLELNNRNHSGNCHSLVMNVIHLKHDQFKINAVEFSDLRYPSPFQVFFENSLQARTSLAFKPSLF